MTGTVRVGISGWQYDSWRGDFYPAGLARRRQLEYVAERMDTVELNGPFYSLQRPTSYQRWYDETPDGFLFAVKGGRFITHFKRLVDVEEALGRYFDSGVLLLGDKLGPILWQLPARTELDLAVLDEFLAQLPRGGADNKIRHALEVRHRSFDDDRFYALLEAHRVSNVLSDSPTWPMFDAVASDLVYVRLHGHTDLYASGYSAHSLDRWAERCSEWAGSGKDVLVYFDNDARGRAPYDAMALARRLS